MVEIGTSGLPWRAAAIAIGATLAAEADGMHAVWFAAEIPVPIDLAAWRGLGGPLSRVVPDPTDLADPVVTATAALLVTRQVRIGILGWAPGPDPVRAARTIASLADLAPGRAVVALTDDHDHPDHLTALLAALPPDLAVELVVSGADAAVAARHGLGWIAVGETPEGVAAQARDAGVTGRVGLYLPVVVHPDAVTAKRASTAGLLTDLGLDALGAGAVVGDAADLGAAVDALVAAGIDRVIIENLLPFGLPDETEPAQDAIRTAVRSARLRHRAREVPA